MALSPFDVYKKAVEGVPSIKYALAVAGVIAAGSITYSLSNQNPQRAILTFVFVLAGMYLLLIFATSSSNVRAAARGPIIVIVWSSTILFVTFLALTLTAFTFGVPRFLAITFGVTPADVRVASAQIIPPLNTAGAGGNPPVRVPLSPEPLQETFRINDSSENCAEDRSRSLEYCLASGETVDNWTGPTIESANCGSSLSNVRRSPGNENCITVDVSVRGCGYDNILGLRNCRGRGWIGGAVVINGKRS